MDVTAKATRSGEWWAVEVPEVPGLFTQARSLEQIPTEVRDAAGLLGADVDDVHVVPQLAEDDSLIVVLSVYARHRANVAEAAASIVSRDAVGRLRDQGISVRDVASIVGVSAQRVSVLDRSRKDSALLGVIERVPAMRELESCESRTDVTGIYDVLADVVARGDVDKWWAVLPRGTVHAIDE